MASCANWLPIAWRRRRLAKPFSRRHWFTKRGCDWPAAKIPNGTVARIFLQRPPKPCDEFLIDNARRKRAARHGGGHARLDINEVEIATIDKDDELLAINEALDKFA